MKSIILAAGEGKRLRPFTIENPKCMVEIFGKPIIDHLVETFRGNGVDNISIVTGHKSGVLISHLHCRPETSGIKFYLNPRFADTNMVYTLFAAREEIEGTNEDIIVSYADIIYSGEVLDALMKSSGDISVVVDKRWRELWEMRMEDPLSDAETMKIENGRIIELGKKTDNYEEIQGQYIGLMKFSGKILPAIVKFYDSLPNPDNMFMTDFLQALIDSGYEVTAVQVDGGWLEVDSPRDVENYERNRDFFPFSGSASKNSWSGQSHGNSLEKVCFVLMVCAFLGLTCGNAHAYLTPGVFAYILQIIAAVILGGVLCIKGVTRFFSDLVSRKFWKREKEE